MSERSPHVRSRVTTEHLSFEEQVADKHKDRLARMAPFVVPEPNDPIRPAWEAALEKVIPRGLVEGHAKKQWRKAKALIGAQLSNGAGYPADATLREFYFEYNRRLQHHGLGSLPSTFNVLEAFFRYDPSLIAFHLLPERDHRFSWVHFIDYITSEAPEFNLETDLQDLPEGTILNFSNSDDPSSLVLSGANGTEFGALAFSIVRHGSEATVVATAGQLANLVDVTEELRESLSRAVTVRTYLDRQEGPPEAVSLQSSDDLWRVLASARFDLEDQTNDVRFVMHDAGTDYLITTDDISPLVGPSGRFVSAGAERLAKHMATKIADFTTLFELCATALQLPSYFLHFADDVRVERTETEYRRDSARIGLHVRRRIPPAQRIAFRLVEVLDPPSPPLPVPAREFSAPEFKIETSGYWRKLDEDDVGLDKNGHPVRGRTWVSKRLTWVEERSPGATLKANAPELPSGPDPGWIYVMRTAMHRGDIFKVGLTRRHPEERADELSRQTNAPDRFFVLCQWPAGDCARAEALVHAALAERRLNDRREFFEIPLRQLISTIQGVLSDLEGPSQL